MSAVACPRCEGVMLLHSDLMISEPVRGESSATEENVFLLPPRTSGRKPLPPEIIEPYRGLYEEAALILQDSPRASAALSRRCLQHLLRELAKAPPSDLYHEIEWVVTNAGLPGYVTDFLHDLRVIGNMAAHPNKSTAMGDYVDLARGSRMAPLYARRLVRPLLHRTGPGPQHGRPRSRPDRRRRPNDGQRPLD